VIGYNNSLRRSENQQIDIWNNGIAGC
jgi:hypothetical protein